MPPERFYAIEGGGGEPRSPNTEIPEELRDTFEVHRKELRPLAAKYEKWKSGAGPKPTVIEWKRITMLSQALLDIRAGRAPSAELGGEPSSELSELGSKLAAELATSLTNRFTELGITETIAIKPPELPETLTKEHLEAIKELFPGAFEERILPTPTELNNLNTGYVDAFYPATIRAEDEAKGLISYRPTWWNENATNWGVGAFDAARTKGEAYLASMRKELEAIGGSLVLLDTATKPNYTNGSQHYGSIKGADPAKDPLLPLFAEAFGAPANRFNHTWDDISTKLLPLAKEKIKAKFSELGLPDIDFEVTLIPATLANIEMTIKNPLSSTTNTWEWTSTSLVDDASVDTGRRLDVGDSRGGGAADVGNDGRSDRYGDLGARLAVVFKKGH